MAGGGTEIWPRFSPVEINVVPVGRNYDLRAINAHRKSDGYARTLEGLLDIMERKGLEVAEALASLRRVFVSWASPKA